VTLRAVLYCITIYYFACGRVVKYCNERLRVSVCPRAYLPNRPRDLYQIFMHVAYRRGSVLLRRGDEIRGEEAILGVCPGHSKALAIFAASVAAASLRKE